MFRRLIFFSLTVLSLFFVFTPPVAAGGCNVGPILPPCVCMDSCQLADLVFMVMRFIQYALGMLAVVCIFMFVFGGFDMILSRGNPEKIQAAKKTISGTVIGMFFALVSWVLINTVVVGLTGDPSGRLFPGQPNQAPWWQLEMTQACDTTSQCTPCDPNKSGVDCKAGMACYASAGCPTGQDCCQP